MEILELTKDDEELFPVVLSLFEKTQGEGICKIDQIRKAATEENELLVVMKNDLHIIAAAQAKLFNPQTNLDFYAPFGSDILERMKGRTIGSLSSMSVEPAYQGQGIGQKLSHYREKWLRDHGATMLVGITWVSGLAHTSDRVFRKLGFEEIGMAENLFVNFDGLKCPVCNFGPCHCPSKMFAKVIG